MTYKHKTHAVDIDGKVISNADVNFYVDDVSVLNLYFNDALASLCTCHYLLHL